MNLKKYLPTNEQIAEMPVLSFLRHLLLEPNLWHMNRYSLSFGFLVGGICCFLPIFFSDSTLCAYLYMDTVQRSAGYISRVDQ